MTVLPLSSADIDISYWISKEARMRLPVQQQAFRPCDGHTTLVTIGGEQLRLTTRRGTSGALTAVAISWGRHGGSTDGLLSGYGAALCAGLDHGVPLADLLRPGLGLRFLPDGRTDDPDIPAASSPVDYCCRRLAIDWLPYPERAALGVITPTEHARHARAHSRAGRPHMVAGPNPERR
jgi:ribonucleoside-diphosphate reductase alpha chain